MDSVEETVEATVDAVDSEVAEEATVDDTDDTTAAATSTEELAGQNGGIFKDTEKDTPVTSVKFDSNGAKKNEEYNVATITNTTDPVSWNNAYATNLIATVLHGGEGEDTWLNNSSKVSVSKNNPSQYTGVENLVGADDDMRYEVIEVADNEYLFVEYGVTAYPEDAVSYTKTYVAGYDDAEATIGKATTPAKIPVTEWDGRQIDYNKSGNHKFTTGKKEALDVTMAFVTYSNGTVTEVNGVEIGSVKVDKKAQKAASVEYDENLVTKSIVNADEKADTMSILEHKTKGDLPYFTIKAKVGTDGKSYKKAIASALKEKKFYFGITQKSVNVSNYSDSVLNTAIEKYKNEIWKLSENGVVSENSVESVSSGNIEDIEDVIADTLVSTGSYKNEDFESIYFDDFVMTKFNEKKASIALVGAVGEDNDWTYKSLKTLSDKGDKGDYSLGTGTVAGETVYTLDFKDGGNFVYKPLTPHIDNSGDKDVETRSWKKDDGLAPLGYKWAFRQTPAVNGKKQKTFRYGIYKDTNNGFVFNVDETAVDSVEEAF